MDLQIFFERGQRHRWRAGIAVGPQRQIDAEHKAVLRRLAHQSVDGLDDAGEIFVIRQFAAAVGQAGGFAVVFINVDEVDVARDIQLAGTEFAHADHPELHGLAFGSARRAVAAVQIGAGGNAGAVEGHFGQMGHGQTDVFQRHLAFAVEMDQSLHHQLAQDAQRGTQIMPASEQRIAGLIHRVAGRHTGWQEGHLRFIPPMQALKEPGMLCEGCVAA